MEETEEQRFEPPRRRLVVLLVWTAAIAWSAYLVWTDMNSEDGFFATLVQIMGSAGILYALFLVMKPRKAGIVGVLDVFREDVVPEGDLKDKEPSSTAARWAIITITLTLAIGGLFYRLAQDNYLHQSAAFFIGVPTILAITLALTPKAKSATGMIVKGMTLALLLSGVVFFEGFICILMAAPLFYLVGIGIGIPIDRARRRKAKEHRIYSIVGITMLALSMEGVTPATSFSQDGSVSVTRTIDATYADVTHALSQAPRFQSPLPFYLKLGFPRPVSGYGSGLEVGDRRTIVFGNESPMEPMDASHDHHAESTRAKGSAGELELKIVRSEEGRVVFKPVRDDTAFTHWITWGRSVVEWEEVDAETTQVTWTFHFRRRLSPSWYFGPWQRYAGEKAVGYLIETVATP